MSGASRRAGTQEVLDRRTAPDPSASSLVLVSTSLLVLLVFVNQTGLTVTLPTISRGLGASASEATWFLLAYMLPMTALILVLGRLTDLLGRRRLYLAGIVVFLLATLGCAVAGSAWALIGSRLLQGVGAAAVVTNTTAILTDVYASRRLSVVLGANATVAAVGQTVGPLVGGLITGLAGWRAMFLVELVFGLVALATAFSCIPRDHRDRRQRERLDRWGAMLSVLATIAIVGWLNEAPYHAWVEGRAGVLTVAAVVLTVAFLWSQTRVVSPLLHLELFRSRTIAVAYAGAFLNSVSNFALVLVASLYLQNVTGFSAFEAGLVVASASLATTLAATLAGRLAQRRGVRLLTTSGMSMVALGAAGLTLSVGPPGAWVAGHVATMVGCLFLVGFGVGLFMTPNTTALMSSVDPAHIGIANAVRTTLQNGGYLFSTALALTVSTAWLAPAGQRAVYDGTLATADGAGPVGDFLHGVRVALVLLAALAAVGAVLCALPPAARAGSPARRAVGSTRSALPEE